MRGLANESAIRRLNNTVKLVLSNIRAKERTYCFLGNKLIFNTLLRRNINEDCLTK